jgi:hypothetical protein
MKVKPQTVWKYVGNEGTKDAVHLVVQAEGGEIITWSEPSKNANEGGDSWMGDESNFLKNFVKVDKD